MRAMQIALVACTGAIAGSSTAFAHGMRSGAMRIEEVSEHRALVRWRQSIVAEIELDFPSGCRPSQIDAGAMTAMERAYVVDCDRALAGETFGVKGLGPVINDATLLVTFKDGRSASRVLLPDSPSFTLPKDERALDVGRDYVERGVAHILSGADHLMFLFLLVLLLDTKVRAILLAESAFTLSHSISFSLTALGWVKVAAPAAEACIALSLLLLALDTMDKARAPATPRAAAWTALVFGSVHGLGFAGGLRELGLPDRHVATALVGFGAGVELGQILFLGGVIIAVRALMRLRVGSRIAWASTYVAGIAAAYWLIARLFVCLCAA
jgi:hypothetical protein